MIETQKEGLMKRRAFVVLFLMLILGAVLVSPASASRGTRLYGSAWNQTWSGPFWTYNPYCQIHIWDDQGHNWYTNTNWRSDWWYDNLPSNQTYHIQAYCSFYGTYSKVWTGWVTEKSWWQVNQTQIPNLICG
jgi:hypothetical protein